MLRELVSQLGTKSWSYVAQKLREVCETSERSPKQCRDRWVNQLDPRIKNEDWTLEEEQLLFEGRRQYGNQWSKIAQQLQGRTENCVKNHFYSAIRKILRQYNKRRSKKDQIVGEVKKILKHEDLTNKLIEFSYGTYHEKVPILETQFNCLVDKEVKKEYQISQSVITSESESKQTPFYLDPTNQPEILIGYNDLLMSKFPAEWIFIEPTEVEPNSYEEQSHKDLIDAQVRGFREFLWPETPGGVLPAFKPQN